MNVVNASLRYDFFFKNKQCFAQELAKFFCKGSGSNYFVFYGPHSFSVSYWGVFLSLSFLLSFSLFFFLFLNNPLKMFKTFFTHTYTRTDSG